LARNDIGAITHLYERIEPVTHGMVRWFQRRFELRGDIRDVTALKGQAS